MMKRFFSSIRKDRNRSRDQPMNLLQGSQNSRIDHLAAYQVEGGIHHHGSTVSADQERICELLQPIEDASHTRDRKRSPPDSACMPGTRLEVVRKVGAWISSRILVDGEPHICWMHGYVGSGKSSISQEICRKSELQGRPVVSFFFFRNAGDRSRIWRFATTLAAQMAAAVPETARFVQAAATASPGLKNIPVPSTSVAMQMQRLVYGPFKSAADRGPIRSLAGHPFLIVIDGLDECGDKDEVGDLIDGMLAFFEENPSIPLRVFITSRVEQHIQSRLNVPGVLLDNLVDHCSDDDITAFLDILFQDARRRDPVIQAYVREHGEWPTPSEKRKLVEHIGGSFIFASAVFRFIMEPDAENNDPTTPMERLPLALKMNPGLDGLYAQTLARSEHLPHFLNVISTIALLEAPLPTSGIAELLGIHIYEVVNVLVNLQAIIQVPGTDDIPVILCHTSLRDFLTTQSRSGRFFAHPRHHVHLYLRLLECELELRRRRPGVPIHPSECTPVVAYYRRYLDKHTYKGGDLYEGTESDSAIRLCREALELHPGSSELVHSLADALCYRTTHIVSFVHLEEGISLFREALRLRPSPHGDRWLTLNNLANALMDRYRSTGTVNDLEEGISLYCEAIELVPLPHPDRSMPVGGLSTAFRERYQRTRILADLEKAISLAREGLKLRPFPHPDRSWSLNSLANSLLNRHRSTGIMADLEEAITLYCEALALRPSPHPERSVSLDGLGDGFLDRYRSTGTMADLEEAIPLHREALALRESPHPERSVSLDSLGGALLDRYRSTGTMADLEEAISLYREALALRPLPHPERSVSLTGLGNALLDRYRRIQTPADLEEAISLYHQALELRPSPHRHRWLSLNNLGWALLDRYQCIHTMADLEEAISLHREALELRSSLHPDRSYSLKSLSISLKYMHDETHALPHLTEAITHCEDLLNCHYPVGHKHRVETLNNLACLLQKRFDATGQQEDLARIAVLEEEASRLSASTSAT